MLLSYGQGGQEAISFSSHVIKGTWLYVSHTTHQQKTVPQSKQKVVSFLIVKSIAINPH